MSSEVANKKAPKRQRYISPLAKQQAFQSRWSVTDRPQHYDPLADPFTSYYFANQSVKQHLRHFKKALRDEEPNKTEQVRLRHLIALRIKEKFAECMCPKTVVYQQEIHERSEKSIGRKRSSRKMGKDEARKEDGFKELPKRERQELPPLHTTMLISSHALTENNQAESLKTQRTEEPAPSHKVNPKQTSQTVLANRLAQELHHKKHEKWMLFLEQKKKLLAVVEPSNSN